MDSARASGTHTFSRNRARHEDVGQIACRRALPGEPFDNNLPATLFSFDFIRAKIMNLAVETDVPLARGLMVAELRLAFDGHRGGLP